jgi:hypothetical protein
MVNAKYVDNVLQLWITITVWPDPFLSSVAYVAPFAEVEGKIGVEYILAINCME